MHTLTISSHQCADVCVAGDGCANAPFCKPRVDPMNLRRLRRVFARVLPERVKAPVRAALFGERGTAQPFGVKLEQHRGSFAALIDDTFSLQLPDAARADFAYHFEQNADSIRELRTLLRNAHADAVLFDVGAHRGLLSTSFCLAAPGARVVAFEPARDVAADAQRIAEMNGVADRLVVRNIALSAHVGSAHATASSAGMLMLTPSGAGSMTIPVSTIDSEVASLRLVPSVIKIDVEGHEDAVLRGAMNTLRQHKPALLLELHLDMLEQAHVDIGDVLTELESVGYQFRTHDGHALPVARILQSPRALLRVQARAKS